MPDLPAGAQPRPGHAELHQRLDKATARYADAGSSQLVALLEEARDAVLTCPHVGCAICWQLDRPGHPDPDPQETPHAG